MTGLKIVIAMIQYFDVFKDDQNGCFQLRTKTNSYALEFDDPEKEQIFLEAVSRFQNNSGISLNELQIDLANSYDRAKIIEVLKILDEHELLPIELTTHVNEITNSIKSVINDQALFIVGNGKLAQVLLQASQTLNFKNIQLYSYDQLTNENEIENLVLQSDFFLVDGNHWSPYHTELINHYALKHHKPWLYIPGVENTVMKIGPLFFGQETGCYHCLISRVKSNYDYPSFLDSYEHYLKHHKKGAKPDLSLPHLDLAYQLIASITLLEVSKFLEQWALPATWRSLISVDSHSLQVLKHPLLKKPFCEACKSHLAYHAAPWLESITLK